MVSPGPLFPKAFRWNLVCDPLESGSSDIPLALGKRTDQDQWWHLAELRNLKRLHEFDLRKNRRSVCGLVMLQHPPSRPKNRMGILVFSWVVLD